MSRQSLSSLHPSISGSETSIKGLSSPHNTAAFLSFVVSDQKATEWYKYN